MEQAMIRDAQGQAITGATSASAALLDRAVRAYNSGYGDAMALCDEAIVDSPHLVMAHLTKAWMLAGANDPRLLGKAQALVAGAAGMARAGRATLQRVRRTGRGRVWSAAFCLRHPAFLYER